MSLIFVTNFHLQIFLCKKSSEKKTRLLWRAAYLEWGSPQPRDKGEKFVVHLLWGLNYSDMRQRLRTLICFIFHALGWLISSWPQIPYVAVWDSRNNPYSWRPSSVCFRFRHWKMLFCEALWNKTKVIINRFKKKNKVLLTPRDKPRLQISHT